MAAGVADGEGEGGPAGEAAQGHHRGVDRGDLHHPGRGAQERRCARGREEEDLVRVLDDAFQTVFRHQDGGAQVVDQALEHRQDLLGRRRVQRRGGFVQDQHLRVRGQDRADRDPLLLAPREGGDGAVAQFVQAQQVQGLLDPAPHHGGGQAQGLHAVRQLVLDDVRHEVRQRVLAHRADDVGEFARPVGAGVAARDRDPAPQGAPGEVRDQARHRAEQRGLAHARRADEEGQLPFREGEVRVPEGGRGGAVVRHRHLFEADHCDASLGGTGATKAGSRPMRIAAAGQSGSPGTTSGTTPGSRASGSTVPA
ncbi:hypothetical protein EES37_02495 [Streptomyces sp. ADI91-18]|nr:hypothetical protein EES37_02495 [Streptomyces sp. ADI91-18]